MINSGMDGAVPGSFVVRTAWPQCSSVSGHIGVQSCWSAWWVFDSTEAFSDSRLLLVREAKFFSEADLC